MKKGIKAGDIIKQVSAIAGGSGGGKPDSAMGGDPLVPRQENEVDPVTADGPHRLCIYRSTEVIAELAAPPPTNITMCWAWSGPSKEVFPCFPRIRFASIGVQK